MQNAPGSANALPSDAFHQRLITCLVRLAAIRSPVALPYVADLLRSYPDKTTVFCSYLAALSEINPKGVAEQLESVLVGGSFKTEWESAWLTRTLARVHRHASETVLPSLHAAVANPHQAWLYAIEAAKLLAARGALSQEMIVRLWNTCPHVFRADLVAAAEDLSLIHSWAEAFVQASQDDPIHVVIVRQLRQSP